MKKFKKLKNLCPALFLANEDEIGQKIEKKNLDPNSIHTRPGQENIEKNSKKIKKPLPNIILCQNGMR